MFSIDFPEIVIILGLALIVLGPKKLPVVAGKIGRWVGRARTMARQFREQLEQEISTAENAADIRKSVDSVNEPARKQPASGVSASAPPESVPQEAVSHGTVGQQPAPPTAHEQTPYEPTPYDAGPYEMPPAEGYGPPPQQLSFDEQLHDTALAPEAAGHGAGSHSADPREWMPETQTWMASAGWETSVPPGAESAAGLATQPPASTPRSAAPQRPSSHDRAPEPAAASPSSRTEAVEHNDR
ncbi:MAG TPA: Sec-independent protein translocase protein TatB [Steroidobacteraceae bacterium]